ncbi:MAG: hypothetical protein WBW01_00855, partial [Terriglobales bacterium]
MEEILAGATALNRLKSFVALPQKFPQWLNSLLKNSVARCAAPSAAKAGTENKAFIAAVNRCATQKQKSKSKSEFPPRLAYTERRNASATSARDRYH